MKPSDIKANLEALKIPPEVQLVAVSKTKPIPMIKTAYDAGQRVFGESYLKEGLQKIRFLKDFSNIEWHFIGHIQSNKAADAATYFDMIQSVGRKKIAKILNETAKKIKKHLPILIQINIGKEPQKSGVIKSELTPLINYIQDCNHLKWKGFMCIPPFNEDPQPYFQEMQKLFQKYQKMYPITELSMGMSADYKIAIEYGATMVRIGTKIFGERRG